MNETGKVFYLMLSDVTKRTKHFDYDVKFRSKQWKRVMEGRVRRVKERIHALHREK